jgi:precorrin-6y C5,15-methyltransferase (decarboxylating) CbiE subunit
MSAALDRIEALCAKGPVAVLVSGDPGLFSLSKLVIKRFGRDRCRVIPGISSIQAAFARFALDWADAKIISAHVSDPDESLMPSLVGKPKIAVLLGRSDSTKWVITFLTKYPRDRKIFVCENLTLEDERIREIQAAELLTLEISPRSLVLLIDRGLLE